MLFPPTSVLTPFADNSRANFLESLNCFCHSSPLYSLVTFLTCMSFFLLDGSLFIVSGISSFLQLLIHSSNGGRYIRSLLLVSFINTSLSGFSRARQPEILGFVGGEAAVTVGSSSGLATKKSASPVSVTVAPTLVTLLSVEISSDSP